MRLAILHPFLLRFRRGIERFEWSLAGELSKRGVDVDLLTWSWDDSIDWGAIPSRVRIQQVPYSRYIMDRVATPFYLKWLLGERYDWVMIFFAGYGEAEALNLLRLFRQQRICIVFHFPNEQVPHRYDEFAHSGLVPRADAIVAVSEYVARGVKSRLGRDCAVIGNGVDADAFCPASERRMAMRRQLGIESDAPVLITLSALEERKGVQWVMRALPYVLDEFPSLQYLVLGDGPHRGVLESEIHQLGLKNHVRLIGNSQEVVSFLNVADIGVLLSYGEAFPIALIEYMAMTLPVVTSSLPPFGELVCPEWGITLDEKDTPTLVNQLSKLMRDPARRAAMGQAGRQQVLQHHRWTQVADQYLELLKT